MPQALVIPSIFTIIDDVSPRMNAMQHNVSAFGTRSEMAAAKADRAFRRLTPGLSAVQSQLLSMVGTGAILAAGFQLGSFSFNSEQDYESAVDQFRVIVSDLNDADFKPFQDKIDEVAKKTKRSGTKVAQAFEQIASKNAKFAQTADGLGQVTQATITLSKAAKMDLGVAAENLIGIMNQFSFAADKADRTINVLAAGQAVGAASITQTAEAFVNLGPTAASANVTIEESVALIQTLAKFSLYGADAGTALRGSIIKLQKAGLGYKSGQFSINDALDDTNKLLDKLHTAKQKDALITAIFGIHNITSGKILTANRETYHEFTAAVTGTSEAQKGAAINSGNLRTSLAQLSAGWVNIITGSAGAKDAVTQFSNGIDWLEQNLVQIVSVGFNAGKALLYLGAGLLTVKTYIVATTVATTAINIGIGIMNALFTRSVVLTYANATAQKAYMITSIAFGHVLNVLAGDFTALSAAMMANPVGFIVAGIMAVAAATIYLAYQQSELRKEYQAQVDMEVKASKSGEAKRLDTLIDKYVKLGKSRKDAALAAIQEEQADIAIKQSRVRMEVEVAKKELSDKKLNLGVYGIYDLPGAESAGNTLVQKEKEAKMLSSRKAELSAFVQEKTNMDKKPSENFSESDKFSQKEANEILQTKEGDKSSGNATKDEITIRVKNDSDSPVQWGFGKSKLTDVMPKVESTKNINRMNYYGR